MIDCDVYRNLNHLSELLPWVDRNHRDYLRHAGFDEIEQPNRSTWIQSHSFVRDDSRPPYGGVPGSSYETMRKQLLDPLSVEYAILTGGDILAVSSLPNPQVAAAIATAYNRRLIETWLSYDPRLKGSLVVATQDAERAAEEIRAFGGCPDVVQVILPCIAASGYGDPHYYPIYEAAVEVGLPVAVHAGGEEWSIKPPPAATGYPSYYAEWHTLLVQHAMSHLISLVFHGVFEKYPELRVVVIEAGVTWLPPLLWRMEDGWKALRSEAPWAKQPSSEVVREHVRVTTRPLDELDTREKLKRTLELVDGLEDMLMLATGYPHRDFDRPDLVSRRLPASWRERVTSENARALYALPARSANDTTKAGAERAS